MYFENLFKTEKKLLKYSKEMCTFTHTYRFWFEHLFERCMLLFEFKNTYNSITGVGIKPKEISTRLYTSGSCGIANIPIEYMNKNDNTGQLTAFFGEYHGISKYYDDKPYYSIHSPIYSNTGLIIDIDIAVIDNSSIRNPITPLIHHYAALLGHIDVSLINNLINSRDSGGVPIVMNERQKESVNAYQTKLFNGQYDVVTDASQLGIEFAGINRNTRQSIDEILDARERILKSFYSAIGVKSAFEKQSNSVVAEVVSDESLLQLNLHDMLECRKIGCEKVNNLFGTNWDVELSKEIRYVDKQIEEGEGRG